MNSGQEHPPDLSAGRAGQPPSLWQEDELSEDRAEPKGGEGGALGTAPFHQARRFSAACNPL